jgi:excisionase family DNA binding protein
MSKQEIERAVYTVREISIMLNRNLPATYELMKRKDFPSIRLGRRIVVPKAAFHRWLEQAALDKKSYDTAENQ